MRGLRITFQVRQNAKATDIMHKFTKLLCAISFLVPSCSNDHSEPSGGTEFSVISHVKDIPAGAFQTAKGLWPPSKPGIADLDGEFHATDQINANESLPYRQLVFAACSREIVYIVYKRGGGRGLYSCFIRVDLVPALRTSQMGMFAKQVDKLSDLLALIRSREFTEISKPFDDRL